MPFFVIVIALFVIVVVASAIPALLMLHRCNTNSINLQRMHSREIAEALVGKKINWDD